MPAPRREVNDVRPLKTQCGSEACVLHQQSAIRRRTPRRPPRLSPRLTRAYGEISSCHVQKKGDHALHVLFECGYHCEILFDLICIRIKLLKHGIIELRSNCCRTRTKTNEHVEHVKSMYMIVFMHVGKK